MPGNTVEAQKPKFVEATLGYSYSVLYNFLTQPGTGIGTDASRPTTSLVQDASGNLYGTTSEGGANLGGAVFKVVGANQETVIYSFCSLPNCADGSEPVAGLIEDGTGNFYGTTSYGGTSGYGTVFKLDSAGQETVLYSFGSGEDGAVPLAGLVMDSVGNLYGTTSAGGVHGMGTVFKVGSGGQETVLYSFGSVGSGLDGMTPLAGVILDAAGNLYGTTSKGGASMTLPGTDGDGTVFKLDGSGQETVLYSFCTQRDCTDGSNPLAGLVEDSSGNLYGTTSAGGTGAYIDTINQNSLGGTVFKVNSAGQVAVLYSFCARTGCTDGSTPMAGLIQDTSGNLYGTTSFGGANPEQLSIGGGTVFKVGTTGDETVLYSFCSDSSCLNGSLPAASLIADAEGNLYGTTDGGGGANAGTAFTLSAITGTPIGTTTTLTADANPQSQGVLVLFNAAIAHASGLAAPTGTVTFTVDGGAGSVETLSDTGQAGYGAYSLSLGMHTITASYSGDSIYAASSGSLVETIADTPVAAPVFSPAPGTYSSAQSVSISESVNGATIYYTTNGTAPSTSSPVYSVPITVSSTETIQAFATASGFPNSSISSATYTITEASSSGYRFVPVVPCRIVDTRNTAGPYGGPELAAESVRTFNIPQSACGIPSTALAYSLNVTVVPNASLDYLTLWPAGQTQPVVSTLNSDGRIKANAAITPAGTNGGVSVYVSDATNVILDIDGYFVPAGTTSALAFYPLTPCRVADTRQATGALGGPSLGAATSRVFPVQSSACNIPATAQAYSLNVTAIPQKTLDYLTAWNTGAAQPNVSTLNSSTGTITANAAIVPAGNAGDISIYVSDAADVILDVNGYFAPPAFGGLSLNTVTPCRVIDTRSYSGAFNGVLGVDVLGSGCAPFGTAQAYVLNATTVPAGPLEYLTLWPWGEPQPYVSTLNAEDGAITSNMAIVPTSDGDIDAYGDGTTNLILDISGYFAP